MGVVIFHRVCGSPGTSRPRNHALFFPSISPPSSLLPLFFFSSFVSYIFFLCFGVAVSRFRFPFFFFLEILLLDGYWWLLVVCQNWKAVIGYGFALYYLRDIYMGISGKERFFLNDCCHNSFNFTKNLSLYIYIDCYMSSWIIKTRSKIF